MTRRRRAIPALFVAAVLAAGGLLASPAGAGAATPIPQWNAAQAGVTYLASQFTPQGYIPVSSSPSTPDLSDTAQTILAFTAANADKHQAQSALFYLSGHIDDYVTQDGADGPGQLAILILDAKAQSFDPHAFGGTDLVARLLATQQTSGADAGLFGTETQLGDFFVGTYQQGLALAALAAAGVTSGPAITAAVTWLEGQQCPDGGWSLPDAALDPCDGLPADFSGPDTNSTAVVVEGLVAEHALAPSVATSARGFLLGGQDADAGWSYYPNSALTPGVSDPDSTALVMQGLTAMGLHPSDYPKGAVDPMSALLSFQLHSGTAAGAFFFPPAPAPASNLATYQAVQALLGVAIPGPTVEGGYTVTDSQGGTTTLGSASFCRSSLSSTGVDVTDIRGITSSVDGKGFWQVGADGGVFTCGDAAYDGSVPGLGLHVDDIVGLTDTLDGAGYWLVGADGAVFAFGDARYLGSLPGLHISTESVVSLVPSPDGKGYLLVGRQGGVFAFGDARFSGSLPGLGIAINDVIGLVPTADGKGYWMMARDGGVFGLGDAAFLGSLPSVGVHVDNVVATTGVPTGNGYLILTALGNVYAFGGAVFAGIDGGAHGGAPAVGLTAP